jgi:hypothetical protein
MDSFLSGFSFGLGSDGFFSSDLFDAGGVPGTTDSEVLLGCFVAGFDAVD